MKLLRRNRSPELACREAVELVTAYLDGALSAHERERFERHLAGCADCPEYLEQIRATIAISGRLAPDDLTPEAREALGDVFRRWAGA